MSNVKTVQTPAKQANPVWTFDVPMPMPTPTATASTKANPASWSTAGLLNLTPITTAFADVVPAIVSGYCSANGPVPRRMSGRKKAAVRAEEYSCWEKATSRRASPDSASWNGQTWVVS